MTQKKLGKPLFITEADVEKTLKPREAIRLVEQCFRRLRDPRWARMPTKIYLDLEKGDFRAMPAWTRLGGNFAGIKWICVFPQNPIRAGLPSVIGTLLLNDSANGRLLAVLQANTITALRTGAAAAVASRCLARRGSRTLGLVGAGVQAVTQLRCLADVFRFDAIRVWSPFREEGRRFLRRFRASYPRLEFEPDIERCVRNSDILSTCTPSRKPLVRRRWVKPGTHLNAIGADAPGKQELETELVRRSRVFVDDWEQASHSGEINVPITQKKFRRRDLAGTLTDALNQKTGRRSAEEITVFDSTGLALQDMALAGALYRRLKPSSVGA